MSHSCYFRIAIDDQIDLQAYHQQFYDAYQKLKGREWFPKFDEPNGSESCRYVMGPDMKNIFRNEITQLSRMFPQFTFLVYCFHSNNTAVQVFRVEDRSCISMFDYETETINVTKNTFFTVYMNSDVVRINNDVTDLFTKLL